LCNLGAVLWNCLERIFIRQRIACHTCTIACYIVKAKTSDSSSYQQHENTGEEGNSEVEWAPLPLHAIYGCLWGYLLYLPHECIYSTLAWMYILWPHECIDSCAMPTNRAHFGWLQPLLCCQALSISKQPIPS